MSESEGPYRAEFSKKAETWFVQRGYIKRWFSHEAHAVEYAADLNTAHAAALASSKPGGIRLALEQLAEEPLVANGCPRCFDSRYIARKALADLESSKPSPAFVAMRTALESIRDGDLAYSLSNRDYFQEEAVKIAAAALALAEKEAGK